MMKDTGSWQAQWNSHFDLNRKATDTRTGTNLDFGHQSRNNTVPVIGHQRISVSRVGAR